MRVRGEAPWFSQRLVVVDIYTLAVKFCVKQFMATLRQSPEVEILP
jgi:hypothetical protein